MAPPFHKSICPVLAAVNPQIIFLAEWIAQDDISNPSLLAKTPGAVAAGGSSEALNLQSDW